MISWELLIPIGAGALRNVAGWLESSLKDGKIDSYEWKKLLSTIFEVGAISIAVLFGFNLSIEQASGVGVLASYLLSALKKKTTSPA